MEDMLERNAARDIIDEELRRYPGTKFYIAYHDVLSQSSSSTTTIRVVFNSSTKLKGGLSLNDCSAKGPCLHLVVQDKFAFIGVYK